MSEDVKKFLRRSAVFAIPALLYVTVVVAVDPYGFFGISRVVSHDLKLEVSYKINYTLWKLVEYRRQPAPNILLGDSRMLGLDAEKIGGVAGAPYYNFAYGGGSLRESIETFWHVANAHSLENAYFGVNLNSWTAVNDRDRVSGAEGILENPLLYFCNQDVVTATRRLLSSVITGREPQIGVPEMTPDEFWQHQLGAPVKAFYAEYVYPERYRQELEDIREYCREREIGLYFIISPSHTDLQAKVAQYGLEDEYRRFKQDLSAIAPTFDFDYENVLTSDRDEYRDPFHFKDKIRDVIVDSVWGGDRTYVRVLGG